MNALRNISGLAGAVIVTTGMVVAFAAHAEAAPPQQATSTRSVVVRYPHLDLSREADARALYRALGQAAKRACGSFDPRNRSERTDWQRCREAALADAVKRLGSEQVAALHEAARSPATAGQRIAAR